ncbi:MAG: hypothetical protein ACRD2A_09060, partial [Vicinamibacterales bacterium]
MRAVLRIALITVVVVALAAVLWTQAQPSAGPEPYHAPRTADGRPDLNGFWQVINTANYDIQAHP